MKLFSKKIATLLMGLALIGSLLGCVGANPAVAPAPLAEIPASLQFPDDIQVETPELNVAGAVGGLVFQTLKFIKKQVLPIGGEFFLAITLGFEINEASDLAVGTFLQELHALQIPLNPVTRTFQASVTGSLFIGQTVKIDFADYDFFGNGTTVGCTGCTCPTGCDAPCPSQAAFEDLRPVCFRIWSDRLGDGEYTRFMAGFFEHLPLEDDPNTAGNEKNPGVGNFRIRVERGGIGGGPPTRITNFGANFNHRNPLLPFDKFTEYFLGLFTPLDDILNASMSFTRVEQQALPGATSEDQLLKTVHESVNQEDFMDPSFNSTFQYVARYRTDADFWSGTFQNDLVFPEAAFAVPPDIANFTAECAQLSTGIGVDQGTCLDIGIDVTNVPFVDLLSSTDGRVNLPEDFPSLPTF